VRGSIGDHHHHKATDTTIYIIERFEACERGFRGQPPDEPVL
jgi:hypothetical protein